MAPAQRVSADNARRAAHPVAVQRVRQQQQPEQPALAEGRVRLRQLLADLRRGAPWVCGCIDVKNAKSSGVSVFETLFETPKPGVSAF